MGAVGCMVTRARFSEDEVIEMRLERVDEQNCCVKIVCYRFLVNFPTEVGTGQMAR